MVSGLNSSLLSYLSTQGLDSASAKSGTTGQATASGSKASTPAISAAALQRAAGVTKAATAAHALETSQKILSTDLRAAMAKAGVKLTGAVEFTVKSDGSVDIKGSDADKAATKDFLSADTSQPSFATRIAGQAREALKLSATIQQSAAISQAAKLAKSAGGVMSLYTSLMQQAGTSSVVFSVSAAASSLTYPGSLTTNA
jgi:hypothetical protein